MPGDWIPMRTDLAEDPAVIKVASILGIDEFSVVGRLHHLWSWANMHLTDGNAVSVTEKWIDRYVSTPGFAKALSDSGWLKIMSDGIEFPKFDVWNSQSGKKRLLTARRVQKSRSKISPKCNVDNVTSSVTKTLPEERREELIQNPPNPPRGGREENESPSPPGQEPQIQSPLVLALAEATGMSPIGAKRKLERGAETLATDGWIAAQVEEFGRRFQELCPAQAQSRLKPYISEVVEYIPRIRNADAKPSTNGDGKERTKKLFAAMPVIDDSEREKVRESLARARAALEKSVDAIPAMG